MTVNVALPPARASGPSASGSSPPTTRAGCSRPSSSTSSRGHDGPAIVCAQAGEVNTGAFDPIADDRRRLPTRAARGATSTAPSACGRRASPSRRGLVDGVERADSWATDGHKWLNVPYDCGIAIGAPTRRPTARR